MTTFNAKPEPANLEEALVRIEELKGIIADRDDALKDAKEEIAGLEQSAIGDSEELEAAQGSIAELEEQIGEFAEAYGHVLAGDLEGAREALEMVLDDGQRFEGLKAVPRIKAVLQARARQ
jgi:chromosome segregation ATPase